MNGEYISESSFIVRKSGRKDNNFYIDYQGIYKITEIAKVVHIEATSLKEIYLQYNAIYDADLDVYYFNSIESAKHAVSDILRNLKNELKGRVVQFTEAEIEYIRQALINEGVNNIRVSSKMKDNIFKKLNS